MPEPTTPATPQAGGAGDPQPQAGDPQPTPQAGGGKTPDDYERIIADLRKENAGHRTKLKKFEDDETQRTQAQMTEQEKLQKALTDAESIHDGLIEQLVDREVRLQAAELGVQPQHLKHVAKLIWDDLEFDKDTGMPTNVEPLLKELLKELDLTGKRTASVGGATNPARSQTGQFSQITRDNLTEAMQQYDKLPPSQKAEVTRLLTNR